MKRALILLLLMIVAAPGVASSLLEAIKARGYLRCGVSENVPGLSYLDRQGRWQGFWVEHCRALATAVVADPEAVEVVPVIPRNRFTLLREGEVDVLMASTTWTLGREATLGVQFTAPLLYDGQGFIVQGSLPIQRLDQAQGQRVCVVEGTTTEAQLQAYNLHHDNPLDIITLNTYEGTWRAFIAKNCELISNDLMLLVLYLQQRTFSPKDYRVLPDIISKEPLTPAVPRGQSHWFDVVRWTGFALIAAEELNLSQDNVVERRNSSGDQQERFLLGLEGQLGNSLGLDQDWAFRIIRDVGNYQEIFSRTIGADSPFGLDRGLNHLPANGGLLYAPPFR